MLLECLGMENGIVEKVLKLMDRGLTVRCVTCYQNEEIKLLNLQGEICGIVDTKNLDKETVNKLIEKEHIVEIKDIMVYGGFDIEVIGELMNDELSNKVSELVSKGFDRTLLLTILLSLSKLDLNYNGGYDKFALTLLSTLKQYDNSLQSYISNKEDNIYINVYQKCQNGFIDLLANSMCGRYPVAIPAIRGIGQLSMFKSISFLTQKPLMIIDGMEETETLVEFKELLDEAIDNDMIVVIENNIENLSDEKLLVLKNSKYLKSNLICFKSAYELEYDDSYNELLEKFILLDCSDFLVSEVNC